VFETHRLLYHSTLSVRVLKKDRSLGFKRPPLRARGRVGSLGCMVEGVKDSLFRV
jgi:hypothetical protein